MMQGNETVIVPDKNGVNREYAKLATFDYNNRKFIIYTDYSKDEADNIMVYGGIYVNDNKIEAITEKEDAKVVFDFIKFLEKKLKK